MNRASLVWQAFCNASGVRLAAISTFVALAAATSSALAGPNEFVDHAASLAIAEARVEQAEKVAAAGDCGVARPIFQESLKYDRSPRTLLGLGDCLATLGMTASAWGAFHDAEFAADNRSDRGRADVARQRIAQLEPKLSKIKIVVTTHLGIEVSIDSVVKPPSTWNIALPVDPGTYAVFAWAASKQAFSKTIEIAGPGTTDVEIGDLLDPSPVPKRDQAPAIYIPDPPRPQVDHHVLAWTMILTGLAGLETALVIGCLGTAACPSSGGGSSQPIHLSPGVVVGTLVGGLAVSPGLMVGGGYVLAADLKRKQGGFASVSAPTIAPLVLPNGGGLAVRIAF